MSARTGRCPRPSRHAKQRLADGQSFTIPPGQFGFLSTVERIKVPDTALAFISIKAKQKFSGLINISGFHVDPGYEGVLLFSVLNAGPRPLHLQQGQPLFLIWYADLDRTTVMKKQQKDGFDGIEPDLINKISGEILSLQSLSDKQRALEKDISQKFPAATINLKRLAAALLALVWTLMANFGQSQWPIGPFETALAQEWRGRSAAA